MRPRLQKVLDSLFGAGGTRPELRRAAASRAASLAGGSIPAAEALPDTLAAWVEKIARRAWQVTDEDVAALRAAGFDEDAIFETTIAAATGAAIARYQIAARAIADAATDVKKGVG